MQRPSFQLILWVTHDCHPAAQIERDVAAFAALLVTRLPRPRAFARACALRMNSLPFTASHSRTFLSGLQGALRPSWQSAGAAPGGGLPLPSLARPKAVV